jgi:hypothetical protein
VQDFLGLRRYVTDRHFYFNVTKGFPCLRKTDNAVDGGASNLSSPSPTAAVVRCLGKNKGRTHPVVDEKVLQRLREFFRPFNKKFYRLTGIDFGWP